MSTIPDSQEVSVSPLARSHSPIGSWIAGLSAVLTGAVCIYYRMFTGFYPWDDEGYLMIGLRSLLHGRRLYDDAYSQYGPFYYLAYTAIYSVLRQPISHDTQRFVGVALWLFSAILWARTAWLLTRSRVWCGFAFFLGIRLLAFFPLSAGHPEELCMALLSIVAVIACGSKPVGDWRSVAALACLVAAITLTKINLGLYVAIALGLMILRFSASTPVQRIAEIALSVAALVLPAALMSRMLGFAWVRDYCFVATVSISAAIFSTHAVEPVLLRTGRFWWTAVLSFIAFAVLVTAPFLVRGTTFKALLYMTVLQHAGSAKNWYTKAPINSAALLWTAASVTILVLIYTRRRGAFTGIVGGEDAPALKALGTPGRHLPARIRELDTSAWIDFGLLGLKTIVGFCCLFAVIGWYIPSSGAFIFKYCVPFAWLVLVQPPDETARQTRGGRIALCLITVFVYLYAYPVAGTQAVFASVPAGILAIVLLRDAMLGIAALFPVGFIRRRAFQFAPALASALIVILFSGELRDAYWYYTNSVSLGMPGATRIRVVPQVAATYRWIIRNLDSCGAVYSMPGLFSLYFWTAQEPPTTLTIGNWVGLLNAAQQQVVIHDLSRYEGMCVVYSPELVEFWRRDQDLSRSPLAQYILTEFMPVAEYGGYYILKRK